MLKVKVFLQLFNKSKFKIDQNVSREKNFSQIQEIRV